MHWAARVTQTCPVDHQDRADIAQRRSGRKAGGQKRSTPTVDRETPVTPPPPEQPPDDTLAPSDTGDSTAIATGEIDPVDATPVADTPASGDLQEREEQIAQFKQEWATMKAEYQSAKEAIQIDFDVKRATTLSRFMATLPPKQKPVKPQIRFTAPTSPVVAGSLAEDLDTLHAIAAHYHGEKGDFAYTAFRWANHALFDDQLPTTLLQWAMTPYGRCVGATQSQADRFPVVTLHPGSWPGHRLTLDWVIHECLHVYILYVIGQEKGHSSHDNSTWASECMRLGPLLGLPDFQAAPTTRTRGHHSTPRSTPDGCLEMKALIIFPQTLRPKGYYDGTALPWE